MRREIIPYNKNLKVLAQKLRNNATKSEVKFWWHIKGKQLFGYDFHRQKPLLNYIADFYCSELQLSIELDGYTHTFEDVYDKDVKKEADLLAYGIRTLRFDDEEVMNDIGNVLRSIEQFIIEREGKAQHTPSPSQEGNNKSLPA